MIRPLNTSLALLLGLTLLALPAAPVLARSGDGDEAVGRIVTLDGELRLRRADAGTIELDDRRSTQRAPVLEGDRLRSGPGSRIDIALGADRLRLDENSVVTVVRLDARHVDLWLERGRIAVLLRGDDDPARWRIRSSVGTHLPLGPGLFRVDAPEDERGRAGASATAWRSAMRIETDEDTLQLPPGRRAEPDGRGGWRLGLPQGARSPARRSTCRPTSRAPTSSTATDAGSSRPNGAGCGCRVSACRGSPSTRACGAAPTAAGSGSTTRPGAWRPTGTGAGCAGTAAGPGCRARRCAMSSRSRRSRRFRRSWCRRVSWCGRPRRRW